MNPRHYRLSETALPVNEIRKTKIQRTTGKGCMPGSLRYPIIDWQAWWRQLYRVLVQLLSVAKQHLHALFTFVMMQFCNLKRYLLIKAELLSETFYEAMDSFVLMGTVAEPILATEFPGHQNSVSSTQRLMYAPRVTAESKVHYFSLIDGFNKQVAKADKPTRWVNKNRSEGFKDRQVKSSKQWFWKKWPNDSAGVLYLNNIMRIFLKIQPITAHPEIGAENLKC